MSLAAFEDFYYGACLATDDDPVGAWARTSEETKRLADWIQGRSEVHVTGEGTDLRLGIEGRTFIAADGEHNMPDGEFFTGPVEDPTGEITFHLPATYAGRDVSGVRLRGRQGRRCDGPEGREFLIEMLDTARAPAASASSASARTTGSPPARGDPARREDRHGPPPAVAADTDGGVNESRSTGT